MSKPPKTEKQFIAEVEGMLNGALFGPSPKPKAPKKRKPLKGVTITPVTPGSDDGIDNPF